MTSPIVETETATGFWQWKNVRFKLTLLLCFNFMALAFMRNGLGMAMVCMVNSTAIGTLEGFADEELDGNLSFRANTSYFVDSKSSAASPSLSSETAYCPVTSYVRHEYEGEFAWSTTNQGMLFAAMYYGSFSSLLGGWLSDRYSPRHILLIGAIINIIGSMLTPTAAYYGDYAAVFVVRCLMGLGQGLQKPAVTSFTARWIPPGERSSVISLYTAGNQMANIIGMPLNAWLCHLKSFFNGWPLIFVSSGCFGLVWCVLWMRLVSNGPENHRRISDKERLYIANSLQSQSLVSRKEATRNVPWKSLITSPAVIACSICSFVNGLVVSATSSYIPTYFMEVLHLDLYSNGFYSSLPFVSQWLLKFGYAILAEKWVAKKIWSPTTVSKMFNTFGSFATAAFFVMCSFLTCANTLLAVVLLCASMGSFAAFTPGYWTSMVSIAPVYTGTVSALTTTTNHMGSILAPYLIGVITVHGTRAEWQIVFFILAASLVASGLFYLVFGSADIQPWARIPSAEAASRPNITDNISEKKKSEEAEQQPMWTGTSIDIPEKNGHLER